MVFAKPANPTQKLLRDKFKSRQDYAQYCSDFDKEADHAYVELCINSSMKDFFQECSGFTPPAPEDEEQRVDDFACIERANSWRFERCQPRFRRCARSACRVSPGRRRHRRSPHVIPAQADNAPACRDTILGRMLADGKGAAGPVKGFDISHHNRNIPWDELIREGNVFVMMKATEGTGFTDYRLPRQLAGSRPPRPHSRRLSRDALRPRHGGANHPVRIRAASKREPRRCDLGAVLDLKSAARGKPVPERDLAAVNQWLDWSRRQLRRPAVLFADTFFFENFLPLSPELLSRSVVWLQEFSPKQPAPPNGYAMPGFIWQFSDGNENVPEGFNGFGIDRDVFIGSAQDFARLLNLDFRCGYAMRFRERQAFPAITLAWQIS